MSNHEPRPLLVLAGPTAVGKSALALSLAQRFPIEIISADARQVYRGLDIGTAKPTKAEQLICTHHCIDIRNAHQSYSASEFMHDARAAINSVAPDKLPVLVGGSGLYISAAIDGLSVDAVTPNEVLRSQLQLRMLKEGKDVLFEELEQLDPPAATKYDDRNPRRILRALEYIHITGKPFSASWDVQREPISNSVVFIVVNAEREVLNQRIDERCEFMWNNGLIKETQAVLQLGVDEHAQSLSTVGYREAILFITDRIGPAQALIDMKTATRRYAKRQRTWFRKSERNLWLHQPSVDDVIEVLREHSAFSQVVDL